MDVQELNIYWFGRTFGSRFFTYNPNTPAGDRTIEKIMKHYDLSYDNVIAIMNFLRGKKL